MAANIREIMVDDFTRLYNQTEVTLKHLMGLSSNEEDLASRGINLAQKKALIQIVQARRTELLTQALALGKSGREL